MVAVHKRIPAATAASVAVGEEEPEQVPPRNNWSTVPAAAGVAGTVPGTVVRTAERRELGRVCQS